MFGKNFELNEQTLNIVEQIGRNMPGGFFIYKAEQPEELLYANRAVLEIFGCRDLAEFKALTGFTFRGMVHHDDYEKVTDVINEQVRKSEDKLDYVEYRIVRRGGAVRWVDDFGHYTETEAYGGIYYAFISDITEKRERMASDLAVRQAVIEALSESYHTVWIINDVATESFSLYRGDTDGATIHSVPIKEALEKMKYSQAKEYYIENTVAPVDRERLQSELALSNIARRLNEKSQFNINYLRMMKDGSERYFRIEFAKVNMPGGKMGVVCGFKDVDDDVREGQAVEKALRDAEKAKEDNKRLIEEVQSAAKLADLMGSVASLLSNMPAMSFSKDAETGKYLACNQSFAEYAHKLSPEEVVGLTDYDIFDKTTADHFADDDRKALEMDKPYIFFEDVPDAGGKFIRNLQTTKLKFTDASGRLCTLGMCVDITEMTKIKAAEAKQQELEQRLVLQEKLLEEERQRAQQEKMITALASDYWSVYYLELDKDEGICYQSHANADGLKVGEHFQFLKAFTAYADKYITEEYYQDFLKFIQPDSIREGLKEERVISYRYMVRRDGKESYEMIRFVKVRHPEDRDDHIVHAVGACLTDVDAETRRSLAQSRALGEALAAAKEANKAKTAFLSNMSHEIRTPMNTIIGLDSIALSDPTISDKTREYLKKINTATKHLLNIINDILDMSRIESGRMIIKNEEFSFSNTLEQVNAIIGGQCRDKNIEYECFISGAVSDYYIGDDVKLRQILINILGNAVKFTQPGGSVTLEIDEIAKFDGKSTLRFIISDTGIGMSREYLPKLFDSFSQEDSSNTNKYGSTGLGMPITKSIVELMNGNIEVESEKGKGTKFTVTVTLHDSDRKLFESDAGTIYPQDLNVLVIDDDSVAREHARKVLSDVGINCDTAASGKDGVEIVRIHNARRAMYNFILVDWKMPDMDGVETTRRIREIVGDKTPIIILTSYNWEDVAEEADKAGVDTFVSKPLIASSVMEEFKKVFRKKKASGKDGKAELNGRRVLVAEDVDINAEIMVMILSMRNMEVDVAENGLIAVEKYTRHEAGYYDAILMDMRMPEMDGLEATKTIRSCEKEDAKTIPIIAMTANAFDEDVQRSMQAGLNAHLSKPVEPDLLFETLESLIK